MDKLKPGNRFLSYILDRCIGKGAFGAVWAARQDAGDIVAIKFEFPTVAKSLLPAESQIAAHCSNSPFFPRFVGSGTSQGLNYLVIESLGLSLRTFQENHQSGILSMNETCHLGISMLQAIRAFHDLGYVHRDIKPANFVFRDQRERQVCLIDYGLAQRWQEEDGTPISPRPNVGFRGTTRYASVNSHEGFDLGRRDDLWSLFYVLVEFAAPPLPWRQQRDKDGVAQVKRMTANRLCAGLPPEFRSFQDHLTGLQFEDDPDYDHLIQLLQQVFEGTDPGSEFGAVMSETYGSMALIVAPNSGSVMGSSSAVEGSWAPPAGNAFVPAIAAEPEPVEQPLASTSKAEEKCCVLL
jgi:tau tubulin kinase